ncbi:MAG: hypothetical protein H7070_03150 [Saprospiraceae bacterium]|nr:hypothetical protein [Pyrinomonadaceae bacterium]
MEDQKDKVSQGISSAGGFAGEEKSGTGGAASAAQMKREVSTPQTFGSDRPEPAGDAGKSFIDQAKDTAGQAFDAVAEKATTNLDERKTTLSGGLSTVADSVRKVGENLHGSEDQTGLPKFAAKYTDTAAEKIEQAAKYFETKDVKDMYVDVENFARKNPAIFVGGAFILGMLAARFIKSSSPKHLTAAAGAHFGSESFRSDETKSTAGVL